MPAPTPSINVVRRMPVGDRMQLEVEVNGPASYNTTTKHIVTATQLGLNRICAVMQPGLAVVKATQVPTYRVLGAVKADRQEQGSEDITFIWTTTPVGATEVTNTTDLSGAQFRLVVEGY